MRSGINGGDTQNADRLRVRLTLFWCLSWTTLGSYGQTVSADALDQLRQSATAALSRSDWSEAASLYQSALAKDGNAGWAHLGLADVYRMNGAWARAVEHYDQALSVNTSDEQLRRLAALCRQASSEERTGVVRAATLRAIGEFGFADRGEELSRDFQIRPAPVLRSLEIRIPVRVSFPRNQFTLDAIPAFEMRQLEEVVKVFAAGADYESVTVEGHTCRCGSDQANHEVGKKRAAAIRELLIARRVAPGKDITAVSYGASKPVISGGAASLPPSTCDRDEFHSQNRRVVIVARPRSRLATRSEAPVEVSFFARRSGTHAFEPLAEGAALRAGDELKLRLKPDAKVYAYAFHKGSTGNWTVLFPALSSTSGSNPANPIEPGRTYSIPNDEAGFVLDSNPGSEETYVYSRQDPDPTLEGLVKDIESGMRVNLLPPLEEAPTPVSASSRESVVSNRTTPRRGGPRPPVPPPPPPQPSEPVEGELQVDNWRDLLKPAPRLPNQPAGSVRFRHVQ